LGEHVGGLGRLAECGGGRGIWIGFRHRLRLCHERGDRDQTGAVRQNQHYPDEPNGDYAQQNKTPLAPGVGLDAGSFQVCQAPPGISQVVAERRRVFPVDLFGLGQQMDALLRVPVSLPECEPHGLAPY
jgi:hypothetical protein